ncbi:MAG: NADH-quinone oxidoreductase subunit D [Myxococcota bacterium]|nr:NADH-quinone oxidoreductase subunit D [Myxococcota bacterium]
MTPEAATNLPYDQGGDFVDLPQDIRLRRIYPEGEDFDLGARMVVNVGPSHPAMHGTIRMIVELDGETIVGLDVIPGYLHRGFEKECEHHTYSQAIPYTDRLNYCSPLINNFCWVETIEKMFGVEVTRRTRLIRTYLSELSRITDHITCLAAALMELGALTPFLWMIEVRDWYWEHICHVTGARLTQTYARIGGVARDLTDDWLDRCNEIHQKNFLKTLKDVHNLVDKNRIFVDRMRGIGILRQEDALSYGVTGPVLRSTGVGLDCRKYSPYSAYDEVEFDVPIGKYGDNYDRYFCRMREMEESLRILEQLDPMLRACNGEEVTVKDSRMVLPPKSEVYSNIEALMNHFKIIMEGVRPPKGECYHAVEGANGELGFYIVSDGTGMSYKARCRPPSFINMGSVHLQLLGSQIADIVPVFGQINMIGGECDR